MRCDFHSHTVISDGTFTPTELVDEAAREGVDVLALTDHDDVSGLAEAAARAVHVGIELMAGVEISVSDDDGARFLHMLGLGFDPEHAELRARLEASRQERDGRARAIVERLQEHGVEIGFERVAQIAGSGTIGRPHVARALVECGDSRDEDEAFGRWLRRGRPAYVPHPGMSSQDAISLIHAAGGVASLAHPPLSVGVDRPGGLEAFVERLVPLGLDGVETQHPGHRPNHTRRLRRYARQFDLIETGGSDFHGANRPDVRLGRGRGTVRVGKAVYDALRARIARTRDNPGVLTPPGPPDTLARPS